MLLFLIYVVSIFSMILFPVIYLYKNDKENRGKIKYLLEQNSILNQTLSKLVEQNIQIEQSLISNHKTIQALKEKQNNFKEELKTTSLTTETINEQIDSLSGFFSIGKSINQEENKKYDSINNQIIYDYKSNNFRDFLDKYLNTKAIGIVNYDDIRNNSSVPPNFSEIATAQCVAVPVENDLYSIVIKKGLEFKKETLESTGISYIFDIQDEIIPGFFYSKWELIKLPIFQKLSNNKWVCLNKGILKLNNDNILETIVNKNNNTNIVNLNSEMEDMTNIFVHNTINEIKVNQKSFKEELIVKFNNMVSQDFSLKNNGSFIEVINTQNMNNSFPVKPNFKRNEQGKYCAIPNNTEYNNFYLFPKRTKNIKIDEIIKKLFQFTGITKENTFTYYKYWNIIDPAIVSYDYDSGYYTLVELGKIDIIGN